MMDQSEYVTTQEVEDGLAMFWQDKPKELPSVLSGFTPAPDVLIKKYGFVTALIWGRVWRYCQGPEGKCRAKLETIAGELGMSERTIIRHIEELETDGYIKDATPNLRNKPHVYTDTGKIKIRISIEATMTESHSRVTESQREGDRESHEESIKKQSKKQKIKEGAPAQPKASDIPELVLFRSVVNHWPKQAQREIVISAIQKVNYRLGRDAVKDDLTPFWTAWAKVSGNEWSLVWLDEWAVSGYVPNGKNGNGEDRNADNSKPVERQYTPEQLAAAERINAERAARRAGMSV